jgi:hypothetical protein
MTTETSTPTKLTATWYRSGMNPLPDRWQALQLQLSSSRAAADFGWARRSSVICKWHGVPACVLAPAAA